MSKRLWNAFYRMLPVSLLETAQPCIENASMDIVIEERMRDGSARDIRRMRHVKVCHSQNECCYYDVPIDPATGIGKSRFPISRQYSMSSYRRMKADSR